MESMPGAFGTVFFRILQRHSPPCKSYTAGCLFAVGRASARQPSVHRRAGRTALREIVLQPARLDLLPFGEIVDEIGETDAQRDQPEEHRNLAVDVAHQ